MRHLFPKKFGLRAGLLSTLAVGMAGTFAYLTKDAGFGAVGAMLIFTIFGTAVFIAVSGSDRLFFTALFTFLFMTFLFAVALFRYSMVGEKIDVGDIVGLGLICYGFFVVLPVAFVWIAPKILKYARRDV